MADSKITALDALTDPQTTDIIPVVDDPGGSAVTKKMTLATLLTLGDSNVVVQTFTSGSGTYTPTSGMKKVPVILVGGGGGGARVTAADDVGGGGGGGGTCTRLCTAAEVGASKSYVVGAASTAGGNGNNSTFNVNSIAGYLGGTAGSASGNTTTLGVTAAGVAGGVGSGGDLNINGQAGGRGVMYSTTACCGGFGGSSSFGGGGAESGTQSAGTNGGAYGGGGGGAATSDDTNLNGGTGAAGVIDCIEFLAEGIPKSQEKCQKTRRLPTCPLHHERAELIFHLRNRCAMGVYCKRQTHKPYKAVETRLCRSPELHRGFRSK